MFFKTLFIFDGAHVEVGIGIAGVEVSVGIGIAGVVVIGIGDGVDTGDGVGVSVGTGAGVGVDTGVGIGVAVVVGRVVDMGVIGVFTVGCIAAANPTPRVAIATTTNHTRLFLISHHLTREFSRENICILFILELIKIQVDF